MRRVLTAPWRKSSKSNPNGACVEVAGYRISSYSKDAQACVEAGTCEHGVAVRDSTDRDGPVLYVPKAAWTDLARRLA